MMMVRRYFHVRRRHSWNLHISAYAPCNPAYECARQPILPQADLRHLLRGQSPLPQSMAITLLQILSPAHLRPLRRGVRVRLAFFVHVVHHLRSASGSPSWSRQVSAPIMMLDLQLNRPHLLFLTSAPLRTSCLRGALFGHYYQGYQRQG